jgi:signal transduction histidine kinase
VATRHGAQLVIESEMGQGSRFTMVFPESRAIRDGARSSAPGD